MAFKAGNTKEKPTIRTENCRFTLRVLAGCITADDPLSADYCPYDLPAFHVPADSGALHGDALSRPSLAEGKGDDVGLRPRGGAVSAARSGALEAAVLPGRPRETLPAEAVQAGQQVGVLQLSAALDAHHRRLPLRQGFGRAGLRFGYFFGRRGHTGDVESLAEESTVTT